MVISKTDRIITDLLSEKQIFWNYINILTLLQMTDYNVIINYESI